MAKKKDDDIQKEANYFKSLKLNLDLLYIFLGERKGSEEERKKLHNILEKIHNQIYTEAVFLLTHTYTSNYAEAKKIIIDIIKHRNRMVELLKRNVSIQVATLDYQENIRNILKEPEIIRIKRYNDLDRISVLDTSIIAYDKKLFDIDLDKEAGRTKRLNADLSLMFIDIENVYIQQNTYNQNIDSEIFHSVNKCIHSSLRKYDSVYGYGGYKFAVLLPLTNAKEAESVASRILYSIKTEFSDISDKKAYVNIGISSYKGEDLENGKSMVIAADKALLKSRKSGKNHIFMNKNNKIYQCITPFADQEVKSITIKGKPLVQGYAIGNIFHYNDIESRHIEMREITKDEIQTEMNRIKDAFEKVKHDYKAMQLQEKEKTDTYSAEIFNIYISLVEDVTLIEEIEKKLIENMLNAEQVVKMVFHQLLRKFRTSVSLVIQEKALDIMDIGKRLLRKLTGIEENILSFIPENSVIFTKRLLPSDIAHLNQKNTSAIITEQGGNASHSAMIARGLGIPAITSVNMGEQKIPAGTEIIIDGYEGLIITHPAVTMKNEIMRKIEKEKLDKIKILKEIKKKQLSINDEKVSVDANVSTNTESKDALACGCDNIGLLRIESLYMQYSSLPSKTQLFRDLSKLLKDYKKRQITVRLTDFGADIIPSYIKPNNEHRSLLGLRGIRFLFDYPEILTDQLRVFLQLSAFFKIRILIPVVTIYEDVVIVRDLLNTQKELFSKKRIKHDQNIQLGAMIELPSALFTFDEILKHSDFISIGTNDLIQYIMAAGRQLTGVSSYYERGHSVIIPQLKTLFKKGKESGIQINVSGELAGNPQFTKELLDAGLRYFSVAPLLVPVVKNKIYSIVSGKGK